MKTKNRIGIVIIILLGCHATFGYSTVSAAIDQEMQDNKQKKPSIQYIVDGKPMPAKEADKMDPNDIDKMEFIKEKEKIRKYTDKEVDMVVLITMKKLEETDTTSVKSEE